jgi:hypothetical protein
MSNNLFAALVGAVACAIAAFGAFSELFYVMGFGIMLPVIASLFRLPPR